MHSFELWLRRGGGPPLVRSQTAIEIKRYNPWRWPQSGKFAPEGQGRWYGNGGASGQRPKPTPSARTSKAPGRALPPTNRDDRGSLADPRNVDTYRVKPGDTLSEIAASRKITAEDLAWLNGIDLNAPIQPGQEIKMPTVAWLEEARDMRNRFMRLDHYLRLYGTLPPDPLNPPSYADQFEPLGLRTIRDSGYEFNLDALDRLRIAEGWGRLEPSQKRSRSAQRRAGDPESGLRDDGGHIIARQFGGPNTPYNLIPQNWRINRVQYRAFEQQLARSMRTGAKVRIRISPQYEDLSRRPSSIRYEAWVDDDYLIQLFPNPLEKKSMSDLSGLGDLYRAIADSAGSFLDDEEGPVLVFASVSEGIYSMNVFQDMGEHIDRHQPDEELMETVLTAWRSLEPEKKWTAMALVTHRGRFQVRLFYADELPAPDFLGEACFRTVLAIFGDKMIHDPMSQRQKYRIDLSRFDRYRQAALEEDAAPDEDA